METTIMEVLVFEVAGQRHGLPVADVRELLPAMAIMAVPGTMPGVEGVINLRGVIVPVVDVRQRFGLAARALGLAEHFIVVGAHGRQLALHVDRAVGLARVDADVLAEIETVTPGQPREARVVKLADGMLLLHEVADLLAPGTSVPPPEGTS